MTTHDGLAPVQASERVQALDVLRGAALFGVFLVNFTGFAGAPVMATEGQLAALPTAGWDHLARTTVHWLFEDKANTLFAFLFGLGFWIQMDRARARGADFERLYLRRLGVLLVIGLLHAAFLWVWDILHLYALAGFVLFALRRAPDRLLLWGGLALAVVARLVQEAAATWGAAYDWHGLPDPYSVEAVLERQRVSEAGDYLGLVEVIGRYNLVDWLLSGLLVGWLFYALGRFMVGAWVGRKGWLQRSADYLPGFRRALWIALPLGLVLEAAWVGIEARVEVGQLPDDGAWTFAAQAVHLVAAPFLATGYVTALVVALHGRTGAWLLAPFAWVGRMALTNYVAQSFVYAVVLFGVWPGLALAGKIGTAAIVAIVVVAFAAQMAFSRWWLGRFRYGPLEWLWRGLTYGRLPPLRAERELSAAPSR